MLRPILRGHCVVRRVSVVRRVPGQIVVPRVLGRCVVRLVFVPLVYCLCLVYLCVVCFVRCFVFFGLVLCDPFCSLSFLILCLLFRDLLCSPAVLRFGLCVFAMCYAHSFGYIALWFIICYVFSYLWLIFFIRFHNA